MEEADEDAVNDEGEVVDEEETINSAVADTKTKSSENGSKTSAKPAFKAKKKKVKKVIKKKKPEEPKKSVTELVLEPKKGTAEIKEVIKESPPPADKVIAPASAVKNLFLSFKRTILKKRLKKRV